MHSFDVVIIGAGLAGLQCAKRLAGSGAKILLVDRRVDLTKGIHTTGIFVRKTLEDFAFPAGTLGRPVRRVTLYSPKLKALALASDKDEFCVGKMARLYESYLEDCVRSGVHFAPATRYISAATDSPSADNGGDVRSVVKLERSGEQFEVTAKVLVGADGANSRVAKDLKLDQNKEWIVGYEEVFRSENPDREAHLHCFLNARLAPGYLAWIADDTEDIHIGVGGYPGRFNPRDALKVFRETIASNFIDFKAVQLTETRGGHIPVGGVLRRIANERGLLIGDAAGAVSPLTAGGLDPCLRLSAMASNLIAERLSTNNPRVLSKFSGELFRSRFVSRLWMRRVISLFTNQTLLELGCIFLRGKIGKRLARHVFFGRGSFPDVEFATKVTLAGDEIRIPTI
jgi:flavin-dependent dehydrogenase